MNYARPPTSRPATRPEATHDSGTLHQNAFRTAARWDGRAARFGLKDVAHSLRLFRRSPGFTIAAVAALTLGIGTNTAIFTVVNAVLLKPVPFPTPIVWSLLFRRASFNRAPHRPIVVVSAHKRKAISQFFPCTSRQRQKMRDRALLPPPCCICV